jgi:hypothetical protein
MITYNVVAVHLHCYEVPAQVFPLQLTLRIPCPFIWAVFGNEGDKKVRFRSSSELDQIHTHRSTPLEKAKLEPQPPHSPSHRQLHSHLVVDLVITFSACRHHDTLSSCAVPVSKIVSKIVFCSPAGIPPASPHMATSLCPSQASTARVPESEHLRPFLHSLHLEIFPLVRSTSSFASIQN